MRVLSSQNLPFEKVFPTLEGKCAYCQSPLRGKQKRWCSDKCSSNAWREVNIRRGVSSYIRSAVFARDKGFCSECGADTEKMERIFHHARRSLLAELPYYYEDTATAIDAVWKIFCGSRTLWQADHIVEVAAGGEHHLDNLQTLCTQCHKAKTKYFLQNR